jgi:hypothetical protein
MAARQSVVRIGALALVDGPSHLERRIRAMQRKRGRHAVARALLVGATGALFVLAACEAKVPTSAEIASMDVATARHSTEKAGMFRTRADRDVDYFVNGVKTSAEMTNAIDGHSIGSVEIVKSERADGRDTVFVTTVDRMPKGSNSVFEGLPSKMTMGTEQTFERRSQDGSLPRKQLSGQQPTFLIDGRESSVNDVAALPESAIRSVSVFKKTGGSINGEASNGVIAVKTKWRTSKP